MKVPPSGTVTFLFTDIEGSTRRWQDEPEVMRALLVEHDAILRDVIDEHRGHLFKHTGDGIAVNRTGRFEGLGSTEPDNHTTEPQFGHDAAPGESDSPQTEHRTGCSFATEAS